MKVIVKPFLTTGDNAVGKESDNGQVGSDQVIPQITHLLCKSPIFCPGLLTEEELISFLRIPEISTSKDYHNVIEHLKRVRGLPRIHICRKALYPRQAVMDWVEKETDNGR